ncbi:cytochrome P450 [Mycolicibacterium agri]|nr:cytochrome P450 [Mycolicibacterium agri]PEG34193.1 cytochrome P450 [Mycolicibacterium agri]
MHRNQLTGVQAAATLADLGSASIAAGVIARRPPVVRVLEKLQADTRALARMKKLRDQFGRGPVELVLPGRRMLVITDPEDVGRVLDGAPDPFHPANAEKRKALQWFQPHGVLISQGPIRQERRRFNEAVLDFGSDLHRLAGAFSDVIAAETAEIIDHATRGGHLDSTLFMRGWWRMVRRLTLGPSARDDEDITGSLSRLRSAGNWSFLSLPHYRARARFFQRLYGYAENPQPDTLMAAVASTPTSGAVDAVGQVPQWLFAFDAAGMASLRALALLASHPEKLTRAVEDAATPNAPLSRQFLRASVLESVRLWPTTPTILRDITEDTEWRSGSERFTVAAGAGLMIVAPAFHRDDELLPFAHHFSPDIWLDGRAQRYPQLVPFSAGPAECPGRDLVLFTTSSVLAHLLSALDFRLTSQPRLSPQQPLPMTVNQFALDFAVAPTSAMSTA